MLAKSRKGDFSSEIPIVLVHLGASIPWYLKANLRYLCRTGFRTVFVTDQEKFNGLLSKLGLEVFVYRNTEEEFSKLSKSLAHDVRFRDRFWYKAIIRFFAIEEYMRATGQISLVHIESDVWISSHFPLNRILSESHGLSYPLCNSTLGIPSVFCVRSFQKLLEFNKFVEKTISTMPNATDMSLLAYYSKIGHESVTLLPTVFEALVRQKKSNEVKSTRGVITQEGAGIFDSNTIGQYFFGWDPRNEKGFRLLFNEYEDHFVDPSGAKIYSCESRVFVTKNSQTAEIYNLHIHSKDWRVFSPRFLQFLLFLRTLQSKNGPKRQRTLQMFYRKFLSLKHKIKRIKEFSF